MGSYQKEGVVLEHAGPLSSTCINVLKTHRRDRQKGRQQFCEEGTDGNVALQAKGRKEVISGCKEHKRSPAEPKKEPAWLTLGGPPGLQLCINNIWRKPPNVASALNRPGSRCLFIPSSTTMGNFLTGFGKGTFTRRANKKHPRKVYLLQQTSTGEGETGLLGTATTVS